MVNIAIVEDEQKHADIIKEYLDKYSKEHSILFSTTYFDDGLNILDDYNSEYDIIFLDIRMKHLDGMATAKRIREFDNNVILIFITSTVQYAVQGYLVDALGYVLKPITYVQFAQLLDKAVVNIDQKRKKNYIFFSTNEKQVKLDCVKIFYIESQRNNIIIHTSDENYVTLGPLKKYEGILRQYGFSKCHNAYIVNFAYVSAIQHDEVIMTNGMAIPISRARKKDFMKELTEGIL